MSCRLDFDGSQKLVISKTAWLFSELGHSLPILSAMKNAMNLLAALAFGMSVFGATLLMPREPNQVYPSVEYDRKREDLGKNPLRRAVDRPDLRDFAPVLDRRLEYKPRDEDFTTPRPPFNPGEEATGLFLRDIVLD
ncbi:hypothetical protein DL96DRAFT_1714081 [Flagelloscypha sp. PMI_526]|nr:hypothetical protein DL96DRAFT_1714081 [Flagelloscypha sp. PMI_526]